MSRESLRVPSINTALLLVVLIFGTAALSGCQKLFHENGALLKGQTVTVGVTVPETPPPAVQPIQVTKQESAADGAARIRPVATNLLPSQESAVPKPAFTPAPVTASPAAMQRVRTQIVRADTVLSARFINEDTVLRGSILVKGSLVVAPQATLRLEPGTQLRFTSAPDSAQKPRLVVQGRVVCAGTAERPVLLTSAFDEPRASDWGGVVLLGSEKKNSFDHCRIEGAESGIEARNAQFSARQVVISRCVTGILLHDSTATVAGGDVSRSDSGLLFYDSDLDLRDSKMWENRVGVSGIRSTFTAVSVTLLRNSQEGLLAEQCRFRVTASSAVENRVGAQFKGGEGQVQQSRFNRNREAGLALIQSKVRINNASFQNNSGSGIRLDNGRGMVTSSVFSSNEGGNVVLTGTESFAALLNWWGGADEKMISAGIIDNGRAGGSSRIPYAPFLASRPLLAP